MVTTRVTAGRAPGDRAPTATARGHRSVVPPAGALPSRRRGRAARRRTDRTVLRTVSAASRALSRKTAEAGRAAVVPGTGGSVRPVRDDTAVTVPAPTPAGYP